MIDRNGKSGEKSGRELQGSLEDSVLLFLKVEEEIVDIPNIDLLTNSKPKKKKNRTQSNEHSNSPT